MAYSWIHLNKDNVNSNVKTQYLDKFYNYISEPTGILLLLIAAIQLTGKLFVNDLKIASSNTSDLASFIAVTILTVAVGARLIQSCYLAKKDYSKLQSSGLADILNFLAIIFFTTGAAYYLTSTMLIAFNKDIPLRERLAATLIVYAILAFRGVMNFRNLLHTLKSNEYVVDYKVEKRITVINFKTFSLLFFSLLLSAFLLYKGVLQDIPFYVLIVFSILLVCFNIIHSNDLTFKTKCLLENKDDTPDSILSEIAKLLSKLTVNNDIIDLKSHLAGVIDFKEIKHVKFVRASSTDVDYIVDSLIYNFKYMYEYLFCTAKSAELRKVLNKCYLNSYGFGPLGYMNFILVLDGQSSDKVGYFKIDTKEASSWYSLRSILQVILYLVFKRGPFVAIKCIYRLRKIQKLQPIRRSSLKVDYLVINEEYRKLAFGRSLIRTIVSGYLLNNVEDKCFSKIDIIVREQNNDAIAFFKGIGFKEYSEKHYDEFNDPLSSNEICGKQLFLSYDLMK